MLSLSVHAMQTCWGVEVWLPSFLNSALDREEWSSLCPCCCTSDKETPVAKRLERNSLSFCQEMNLLRNPKACITIAHQWFIARRIQSTSSCYFFKIHFNYPLSYHWRQCFSSASPTRILYTFVFCSMRVACFAAASLIR